MCIYIYIYIANLLLPAAVRERVDNVAHVPGVVRALLQIVITISYILYILYPIYYILYPISYILYPIYPIYYNPISYNNYLLYPTSRLLLS